MGYESSVTDGNGMQGRRRGDLFCSFRLLVFGLLCAGGCRLGRVGGCSEADMRCIWGREGGTEHYKDFILGRRADA